jgi:CelD/BcsL family acetyltransferase involved in cellulose biosynthesis
MRVREAAVLPAALADPAEFQLGPAWFAAVAAAALPAGAAPLVLIAEDARGTPRVALPLFRHADGTLAGLTAPYTSVFRPLAAAGVTAAEVHAAGRAFARACRGAGPLRLDALDGAWPGLAPLLGGFRAGGMPALRFAHFGNWHADVAGQDWAAWLAARPGALRSTIRRRLAQAAREAAFSVEIVRGGAGLAAGIAAYAAVHEASWKDAEPYPRFPAALIEAAAGAGALRLGLLRAAGVPVAAQIWTVAGGTATVHKLVHAEAARAQSPGTVLTAHMVRHLLDAEHVAALDFGRGDDPYKAGWTGARRARIGVLLCPPWQIAGAAAIARHLGGRARALLASVTETR